MWYIFDSCADSDFVNCRFKEAGECLVHSPKLAYTPPKPKEEREEDDDTEEA